ncbi:MAG: peptidylprolyl isomerase [Clostridia bacterium]|nr:peptidylprolyl isomerase [Clostridia bacterium]
MHKKALLALLLAVTMLLSGCALIEKDEAVDRATEIIKVGDNVHTKGEIQDQVNYQLNYMSLIYSMYGMSYDTTDADNISSVTDSVIDSLIENDVKNMKIKELGLDQLTEEETAELENEIADDWQSTRDQVQSYYLSDTELTGAELEKAIDETCEEYGITYESVVESTKETYLQNKLKSETVKDVAVTDEELQTELDSKAESAKTTYTSSPASYGTAVNNGTTVYYRPAGYRMVKQILVKFTENDQAVIDELTTLHSDAETAVTEATTALTDLGVEDADALAAQVTVTVEAAEETAEDAATTTDLVATDTDLTATATDLTVKNANVTEVTTAFTEEVTDEVAEAAKTLAQAKAEEAFYADQLAAAKTQAYANIAAKADEILAKIPDGDWDTLMAEYTEDPGMQGDAATAKTGYAVSEATTNMDTAFTTAALALANVGDVSDKVEGIYGYYIIKYVSDVTEGPVSLDEVRDTLTESVLTTKQNNTYDEAVEQWVSEANATVDRNALNN